MADTAEKDDIDIEEAATHPTWRSTQINFGDDGRPTRARQIRGARHSSLSRSISRSRRHSSVSGDSIRSFRDIRERRLSRAENTIPIEYRTLSFQISQSQAKPDVRDLSKPPVQKLKTGGGLGRTGKKQVHKSTDFETTDIHTTDIDTLYKRLRTSPTQGLGAKIAAKKLQEDGPNTLPQRKPSYIRKLLGYVFGGFCSILWVGVIIFFICWRPLGDPDPQPYNLGLAVLVIIVILLQAAFSAFQDYSTAKTMNSIMDMLPVHGMLRVVAGSSTQLTGIRYSSRGPRRPSHYGQGARSRTRRHHQASRRRQDPG